MKLSEVLIFIEFLMSGKFVLGKLKRRELIFKLLKATFKPHEALARFWKFSG